MRPLTGEAVAASSHEMHNQYGATDEFLKEANWINNVHMDEGRCVLTYMWGDLFRRSNAEGSILHDKLGKKGMEAPYLSSHYSNRGPNSRYSNGILGGERGSKMMTNSAARNHVGNSERRAPLPEQHIANREISKQLLVNSERIPPQPELHTPSRVTLDEESKIAV
ncbi:unnamed protein product [Cylindrotheca closterium]|uniref:Uncharacterized protein n=1 Tax=Cylindrotheca closterium TaxID=2856 RepID=A0AAD2JHL5_9STRA|nr:unnamed protein product [Cylindrotheca closterium]